jgi:hypothetical protein
MRNFTSITAEGKEITLLVAGGEEKIQMRFAKWQEKGYPQTAFSFCNYLNLFANEGLRGTEHSDNYRLHAAYSNSRLSEIRDQILGRVPSAPSRAFTVGSALHDMVLLENKNLSEYCLRPSEEKLVTQMAAALRVDGFFDKYRKNTYFEEEMYWDDCGTELKCKLKTDAIFHSGKFVIEMADLKTTSAATQEEFEEACRLYEYYRQAAFYIDGGNAAKFTIIGVSKRNLKVFKVELTPNHKLVREGRRNYKMLLKKAKRLKILP